MLKGKTPPPTRFKTTETGGLSGLSGHKTPRSRLFRLAAKTLDTRNSRRSWRKRMFGVGLMVFFTISFCCCETLKPVRDLLGATMLEGINALKRGKDLSPSGNGPAQMPDEPEPFDEPDTAAHVGYLTRFEKDVVLELNKARSNPQRYAERYVESIPQYFEGGVYAEPGQIKIAAEEGAVQERVAALPAAKRAGVLRAERGLWLATRDHTVDQGATGMTGHDGSDGSDPAERGERYGERQGPGGEHCYYGQGDASRIVEGLLIDDGVPSRVRRESIINGAFAQVGVSVQPHPVLVPSAAGNRSASVIGVCRGNGLPAPGERRRIMT